MWENLAFIKCSPHTHTLADSLVGKTDDDRTDIDDDDKRLPAWKGFAGS